MIPKPIRQWLRLALPTLNRPVAWLVDVDDTLIDTRTMHHRAADAIANDLTSYMPQGLAISVSRRFRDIFDELILAHQQSPRLDAMESQSVTELEERARSYQEEISATWGLTRLFSREVMLRIAVEDRRADLRPDEMRRCIDRYWDHMLENPVLFADAVRFSQRLNAGHSRTYLMTSSDARYRQQPNGQFSYDPRDSGEHKQRRIASLREHGINYTRAFIGDPVDKPTEEFFQLAFSGISEDLRLPLDSFQVVAVGDSYRSDIQTPIALLETTIGILYRRGQADIKIETDRVLSVGDFDVLAESLDLAGDEG